MNTFTRIGFVILISYLCFNSNTVDGQSWGKQIVKNLGFNQNINYTFFSNDMSWLDAEAKCRSLNSSLICFSGRSNIMKLLQSTLDTWGGLQMWMGRRSCEGALERFLYLAIEGYGTEYVAWDFSFHRNKSLPFICQKDVTPTTTLSPITDSSQHITPSRNIYCPKILKRDLDWPSTPGNTKVKLDCPPGKIGYANWFCNATTGQWYPDNPDLSDCNSVAMSAALQKIEIIDIEKTTSELHQMIRDLKYGGELTTAVEILDKVEDVFMSQAPAMSVMQRKDTIIKASDDIMSSCDKLIQIKEAWGDIPKEHRSLTATKFLSAVDETGFLLASNINDSDKYIGRDNVVLQVSKAKRPNAVSEIVFTPTNQYNRKSGSITLTVMAPRPGSKVNETSVVFAYFSDLRSVLPAEQLPNFNERIDPNIIRVINSPVISANISGRALNEQLHNGDVKIVLEHFAENGTNPRCVFWDTTLQKWNSEGCKVLDSNASHTTCSCNHLTNFAVLMDMQCLTCALSRGNKIALNIITLTGCLVSMFSLSICIVVFTWYRSLWGIRTTIHRNLCISLWFAEAILLVGLDRTENQLLCSIIAGALHYFFLCVFFWMFLEAFHIMILLIRVFTPKSLHIVQHYLVGYGCPAIIVATTASLRYKDYGTEYSCWINASTNTMWSFIGPVIAILAFNAVTLGKALWTTNKLVRSKDKMPIEGFKMWVRGASVLMPLLGLTWIFGFLYFDDSTLWFAYVFAILNSLQGFGIFVFHVLLNKKVKQLVSRSFQRSSLSRSGTTRTTKSSSFRSWPSSRKTKPNRSATPPNSPGFETGSDDSPKSVLEVSVENEVYGPVNPRITFLTPNAEPIPEIKEPHETEPDAEKLYSNTEQEDDDSEEETWRNETEEPSKYEEASDESLPFREKDHVIVKNF